jgi:ATP-binding cassette, subfamily B, bacterial
MSEDNTDTHRLGNRRIDSQSTPLPQSSSSLLELIKACWSSSSGERFKFYLFITLFVVSNIFELLVPWAIGYTLEVFVKNGFTEAAYRQSLWGIGIFVLLRFGNTITHHFARYFQNTVAYSSRMHTLNSLFKSFLQFPLNWHLKSHSGENLSKLHRSSGAVEQMIGTYSWQVVEGFVKVSFATTAIFALDFWVAINVLSMGVVTILLMIYFNSRLATAIRENNSFANKINRICVDYLFHTVTVKTLGLEKAAGNYLQNQFDEGLAKSKRISKFSELKWGTTATGYGLVMGSSLLIYFYGHRGITETFDLAKVYVLLNYLDKIFQAIGSFTAYYGGIIEASIAYEDAHNVYTEIEKLKPQVVPTKINKNWNALHFKNVHFQYDTGDSPGLRDLTITIRAKDKIALVGPSGGGKSTFLKIFAGLLIPERYEIETDTQRHLSIYDVGQISLLVPQEPEIFSESLYYNLTMGEDVVSAEDIQLYIEICKLKPVIEKLPQGLYTDLAQNGLNMSVGEKQRAAMTRGLLRASRRDVILLDEPTSSLDPKTEKEIFFSLLSHFADRTILTACHRLNLVPLFDTIVYISGGRVQEVGSFHDLISKKGLFFKAWDDYERKVAKVPS